VVGEKICRAFLFDIARRKPDQNSPKRSSWWNAGCWKRSSTQQWGSAVGHKQKLSTARRCCGKRTFRQVRTFIGWGSLAQAENHPAHGYRPAAGSGNFGEQWACRQWAI